MSNPGEYTNEDWKRYYCLDLRFAWMRLTPREVNKLRKRHGVLVKAIEGIMKYDR